jgi:hypothetical protein
VPCVREKFENLECWVLAGFGSDQSDSDVSLTTRIRVPMPAQMLVKLLDDQEKSSIAIRLSDLTLDGTCQ